MIYKNNNMKSWWLFILALFSIWLSTGHGAAIGQELCNCQPTLVSIILRFKG